MVFERAKCGYCGIGFRYPREYGVVRYCSARCRVSHHPPQYPWEYKGCVSSRYYSRRRRALYKRGDKIDPLVVYMHHDWTCWLCGGMIDPTLCMPDPGSASIDHVVPLKMGGRHVWENVRPAHKKCNEGDDEKDTCEQGI